MRFSISNLASPSCRLRVLASTAVLFLAVGAGAQAPIAIPGTTSVGQQATPVAVTVNLTASGTAATPQALTQGVASADFALTPGGTCSAGATYTSGQQCMVQVVFAPKFPGRRSGSVVLTSNDGRILGSTLLTATASGSLAVLSPGQIDTVAGDGDWIYTGDGNPATQTPIFLPTGVVVDPAGNIFLSDTSNNRIRRVDAVTGVITTVAGNGNPGYNGDGGPATQASVSAPAGLTLDGAGNIYFVDTGNQIVRRIDAVTGVITTVAGLPTQQGYSGDGAAATAAKLSLPESLAFDAAGNLYIADTGNNVVREVDAVTGNIRTIAGTGIAGFGGDGGPATSAKLNSPWSVAVAPDGTLYIADPANNRIRRIDSAGNISTVAGSGARIFSGDNGPATSAALNAPSGVALDPAGNLYIADSGNNRVREVSATTGKIDTLTGVDSEQFAGDGGPAIDASLYGPEALYFDQAGNLFLTDMFHNRVREISASTIALTYDTIRVSKVSPPQIEGVVNDGNTGLTFSAPALVNAELDASTTTCATGSLLAASATCNLGVEFAPTSIGADVLGSVTVNSDAGNTPPVINVSGQVLSVQPTSVALTSSANPSLIINSVNFTATVSNGGGSPTGSVTFYDGTNQICNSPLSANGTATCSTFTLALGPHNMTAAYSGDPQDASSVSPVLVQVVKQSTTLAMTATPNPATITSSVAMSVTATASSGTPTGTITFYDGSTAIGTASLNAYSVATLSTTQLTAGTHSLSAQYSGDATDATAQSNVVSEVVQQATTQTTLAASLATAGVGTSLTFTSTVTTSNGPAPTGTVSFSDGMTALGSATLSASGVATFQTAALAPGAHNITATYSGDTNDATSASAPLLETIQQLGTTTMLSSDLNPANAGATVHFTASVSTTGTPDGPITGTITFSDGTTVLGTEAVDANGNATLPESTLVVGVHGITAAFSDNTNYAASTSSALRETVNSTGTTIVLTAGSANTLAGQAANFTATVTTSTGVATGTVTFRDGATVLGTDALNAQGVATFSTTALSIASHTITAVYAGDSSYTGSTSAPYTETVAAATTTLTLAGPANPVDAGTTLTLTGALTGNGVTPSGAISLRDAGVVIATQTIAPSGSFSFSSSTLAVGTHSLTAVYAGDADNASSTSNAVSVVIQLAATTTSLSSNVNPQIVGQAVTLTAPVASSSANLTGSVSFEDGATLLGSVALTNGTASYTTSSLGFGPHTLTAVYSGDSIHAGSTSAAIGEQIVQAASAALVSSLNPAIAGTNVVFTVKIAGVGGPIPTGSIVFADGASALGTVALDANGDASFQTSALAVGSHSITASYAGDAHYSSATATLIQTIQNASTQIALTASANPAIYATPLGLTAAITSDGGIATGSVSFTDGGAAIGTAAIDAQGSATLTLATLTPGTHSIVANYAGDGKASASASTPLTVVVKQLTQTALASNANPAQTLSAITLTATVSNSGVGAASGAVTFSDGTTLLGTSLLDATGHATLTVPSLAAGNHAIEASYAGDGADFSSVSPALAQGVVLRPTTTALTATQTNANNPLQVTLIGVVQSGAAASSAPSGTVTFLSGSTTLGSSNIDNTGVATLTIFLQSTTESISASYGGDTAYAASNSLVTTVTGGPATQFTMTLSPASVSIQSKQHIVVNLTLSSVKDFADTMQLGCLGLPTDATCTFSSPQAVLAANGTTTVQLTIDTGDPLGAGEQARLHLPTPAPGHAPHSGPLLCFLPLGALAALGLAGRRRSIFGLLLLVCAIVSTMGLSGCAGLNVAGTPPGTYSFKVSAAGKGSGAIETQVMTLTVTQ